MFATLFPGGIVFFSEVVSRPLFACNNSENLFPVLRGELKKTFLRLDFEYNQAKPVVMKSNTEAVVNDFKP
jgi:hypothetical protein